MKHRSTCSFPVWECGVVMSSTLCPAHSSLGDFHRRVEVRCVCVLTSQWASPLESIHCFVSFAAWLGLPV